MNKEEFIEKQDKAKCEDPSVVKEGDKKIDFVSRQKFDGRE